MKRTLFLNPPAFEGFDGGAGARFQARREVTSFWYPTWLAQAAALVPGSKLIDAPPRNLSIETVLQQAAGHELVILHTSTPSLANDIQCAEALKAQNPAVQIGFVGSHVMVLADETLTQSEAIDFVCRGEFDQICLELAEGRSYDQVKGLSYRDADGTIRRTENHPPITDWDALPSVLPVYHRDLRIEDYFIGYLLHPYVSFYTGRGCPGRCSFCLWPQTIAGRRYRAKSPEAVIHELEQGKSLFPQAREWFFDDDTFTADRARAVAIAKGIRRLGLTWSCNSRANLDYATLKQLRDHNLRLLVVGFESGNEQILKRIRKGVNLAQARRFMDHCRNLEIRVHGTFIIGLPIETRETIEETIRFAEQLDPYTIQVSIAAPYPGTELYQEAVANGWLEPGEFLSGSGFQTSNIHYPDLSIEEIEESVARMYRRFYFRLKPIFRMLKEMAVDRRVLVRRLREGREFIHYLNERGQSAAHCHADRAAC